VPVHVQVPIRVRLASADLADMNVVEEAVAEAVERALARSREAVVEPRGSFARPRLESPTYVWTGRAGDVEPTVKTELEMRIARAVENACAITRLTDPISPEAADEVFPPAVWERFDPARWDRRARTYEIPSYGPGPKGKKKKTTKARVKGKKGSKPVRTTVGTRFVPINSKHLWFWIEQAAVTQFPAGLPDRFVMILEGTKGQSLQFVTKNYEFLSHFVALSYSMVKPEAREKPSISPHATYTFEFEYEGDVFGHEWFRDLLRKTYLTKHGKSGAFAGETIETELFQKAQKYVEKLTEGYEQSVAVYYGLKRANGEFDYHKPFGRDEANIARLQKSWPVLSVTEPWDIPIEEAEPAEEGGGGEAEAGKGAGTSGLDEYGDYEGGVAGGIGIALSSGGYSAKASSIYPPVPGEGYDVKYERYWGEPPLNQLGDAGQLMQRLIGIIARMLEIPSDTQYAAGFTIVAARIVAERAQQVTRYAMDDRVEGVMLEATSIGARDKKGQFYFKPVPSVASQYLQHLARVIPLIRQLTELVLVHIGRRPDTAFTWGYHFFEQVAENAFNSCKHLFIYACQISLLQYLRTTRNHIAKRRANLDNYVKTFAVLLDTMLADHTELVLLRNALDKHISGARGATGDEGYEEAAASAVLPAALNDTYDVLEQKLHERDLMLELTDPSDFVQRRGEKAGELHAGEIVWRGDAWTIRDSKGKEWRLAEMDRAMDLKRRSIESIDPLVTRVSSYQNEIRPLVDDPTKVKAFVVSLLDAMETKNLSVTRKVEGEYEYAFEHGIFREADKDHPSTPGHSRWILQGVHRMADDVLGSALAYDPFYTGAVDRLISHEKGARELLDDLCFVGSIALSIFCPPLGAAFGFVTGMVMGYVDYSHAKELEEIHGAVVDPEKLLSAAEINVMIFCAKLSMALSFVSLVPFVGKAGSKGAAEAAKKALREGIEEGVEAGAKRSARRIAIDAAMAELRALVQAFKSNLAGALALEVVEEKLEDVIVGKVMDRVIQARLDTLRAEARAAGVQ
jgi:hypothetical protein